MWQHCTWLCIRLCGQPLQQVCYKPVLRNLFWHKPNLKSKQRNKAKRKTMFRCRQLAVSLCLAAVAVYVEFLLTMDADTGKLIDLVKERRALYDANHSDHGNRKIVELLWMEISIEINWEISECKRKWASLRIAYARYLREARKNPLEWNGNRKKWCWANRMSFLIDYVNSQGSNNISGLDNSDLDSSTSLNEKMESMEHMQSDRNTFGNSHLPTKRRRTLVPEPVAEPTFEFVQTRAKESKQENGSYLFFMSLLADHEKLSTKRQRDFKMHMLSKMNDLQEDEDNEDLNAAFAAAAETKFSSNYEQHNSHSNKSFERF